MKPEFIETRGVRVCDVLVDDYIKVGDVMSRVIDIGGIKTNITEMDHVILSMSNDDVVTVGSLTQVIMPKLTEITIWNQAR